MRTINKIIIHCAATKPSMDIGAKEIRDWHIKGNGWDDIGYHYVIRRNGVIENGRSIEKSGAHTQGHNVDSIGVCLAGGIDGAGQPESNFTAEQWQTLATLVHKLHAKYPNASIKGHNNYAAKACPCFDVPKWWDRVK